MIVDINQQMPTSMIFMIKYGFVHGHGSTYKPSNHNFCRETTTVSGVHHFWTNPSMVDQYLSIVDSSPSYHWLIFIHSGIDYSIIDYSWLWISLIIDKYHWLFTKLSLNLFINRHWLSVRVMLDQHFLHKWGQVLAMSWWGDPVCFLSECSTWLW